MASFFRDVLGTKSPNPIWANTLPFLVAVVGFAIVGWMEFGLIILVLTPMGVLLLWFLEKLLLYMKNGKLDKTPLGKDDIVT